MSKNTGYIDFPYGGETFQTWYKTIGDLESSVRPLVILHGGPGISHDYMLPHTELFSSRAIPIVFYDQIGIGKSTHLRDKPKEFWSVGLFVQELDNVLNRLGIADNFDLLGHSWGGMLAAEYAIDRQPRGLQRLVLSSSLASSALWEVSSNRLLDGEPQELRETIRRHEKEGTTNAQDYKGSLEVFASKYMCRVEPWPMELLASFAAQEEDPTVYAAMFGSCKFTANGSLKSWSIVDKLNSIQYPTLVTNGVYDQAQDECVLPFLEHIPKVKWVKLAKGAHMAFFGEERDRYLTVVGEFLRRN